MNSTSKEKTVTVKEIVEIFLREYKYDGLFLHDCCACETDDLEPCDGMSTECAAGYLTPGCSEDCSVGGCDFHIGPKKPGGEDSDG